ncbi:uncharacterized protein PHALS_14751 [Plasmopara halstedii]|uniref:Uncharacterized protein n=1 Tax=Plasmopara halstedii TaxID=4781 RepID=A0A0N7L6C1_PLAHL|nr:uncharacterized protein PHALS_14751 [Plasmopara halstedii]CEG43859.1 hypothetical protein PHALS_14751 [Plasmopara halstedii]|eukprot:XP_024580228.1 hypothetical protein PHALS_14751 [Plasmopara halstedii]
MDIADSENEHLVAYEAEENFHAASNFITYHTSQAMKATEDSDGARFAFIALSLKPPKQLRSPYKVYISATSTSLKPTYTSKQSALPKH